MKNTCIPRALFSFLLLTISINLFSQDEETNDQTLRANPRKSRFLTGLYVGSYFANKYPAGMYSGYGFDVDGNRNTFDNSLIKYKLINEYGGGNGQHDYIADELGVDQRQWTFNESDMPFNMHYTPAILIGANFKIPLSKRSSILVNVNGTKLNIEGNFTITTYKPNNPNPLVNTNVQTFAIRGKEQRLLFQLGYQHLFGGDEMFNFLLEGGLVGTLVKFDKNIIYVNTLTIDLMNYVNQTAYYAPFPTRLPVGFALGGFAGMGINLDTGPKFNIQLLYSPSYEKINIGADPKHKFQHAVSLRIYYKVKTRQRLRTTGL